jgi:hypothetical protein
MAVMKTECVEREREREREREMIRWGEEVLEVGRRDCLYIFVLDQYALDMLSNLQFKIIL